MSKILRHLKFLEEITGETYYLDYDTNVRGRVYYYVQGADTYPEDKVLLSFLSQADLSTKLNAIIKEELR